MRDAVRAVGSIATARPRRRAGGTPTCSARMDSSAATGPRAPPRAVR